jgi:hypothetical protein
LAHVVLLEGFRATFMYERGRAPFKARDSGMIGSGMRSQVFWPFCGIRRQHAGVRQYVPRFMFLNVCNKIVGM